MQRKELSPEEKINIRKEKNRQLARQKRARDKDYLRFMEERIETLNTELNEAKSQAKTLQATNIYLKDEIEFLKKTLLQAGFNDFEEPSVSEEIPDDYWTGGYPTFYQSSPDSPKNTFTLLIDSDAEEKQEEEENPFLIAAKKFSA